MVCCSDYLFHICNPSTQVDAAANKARITREVDGGLQTLSAKLPVVITADLRLNTPRCALWRAEIGDPH